MFFPPVEMLEMPWKSPASAEPPPEKEKCTSTNAEAPFQRPAVSKSSAALRLMSWRIESVSSIPPERTNDQSRT